MVPGFLETVSLNGSLIFEIWVDIQGHRGVGMVALKVAGEDLECNVNLHQKGFVWTRRG